MTDIEMDLDLSDICRICLESEGKLIAPCNCKGTAKFVHRQCLDVWKATSKKRRHRTHCDVCTGRYGLVAGPNSIVANFADFIKAVYIPVVYCVLYVTFVLITAILAIILNYMLRGELIEIANAVMITFGSILVLIGAVVTVMCTRGYVIDGQYCAAFTFFTLSICTGFVAVSVAVHALYIFEAFDAYLDELEFGDN